MRRQYVVFACLLSIIAGTIFVPNFDGYYDFFWWFFETWDKYDNSWIGFLSNYYLFLILIGIILNLHKFLPTHYEAIKESFGISGCFSFSIFLKFLFQKKWYLPVNSSYNEPYRMNIDNIVIAILFLSLILIITSFIIYLVTILLKNILQVIKVSFDINSQIFEVWKKIILGATLFVIVIFIVIKFMLWKVVHS